LEPAFDKVGLLAHPWELPSLLPDSQDLQRAQDTYLIIRDRSDVRTDLLRELGEIEVLGDAVRVVPDPYSLFLFPLRYYVPYVEDMRSPFLAQRYSSPSPYSTNFDSHLDFPRGPYKDEDDYVRYDIYSHPAVKPVAIIPGDEHAVYYPASYPIVSTLPIVPAPPPPAVAAAPIILSAV
jgi:hypothetical protein